MPWLALHAEVVREFAQPTLWEWMLAGAGVQDIADFLPSAHVRPPRETKRRDGEPCPGCGKHFLNRSRGWLRTYCSDKCRRDYHNRMARPRPVRPERCLTCNVPIEQRGHRPRRFCGPRCARRHKR